MTRSVWWSSARRTGGSKARSSGGKLGGSCARAAWSRWCRAFTSVTVDTPRRLADWARSFAPASSDDNHWQNLDDFDGRSTAWPLDVPVFSVVALLEMLPD
jgi:hypothetical protein